MIYLDYQVFWHPPKFIYFHLYFTDYAITVVLTFLIPPSTQRPPLPREIPTSLFMTMGYEYKVFGYSSAYNVLYIPVVIL